jgi:hypothetical protein
MKSRGATLKGAAEGKQRRRDDHVRHADNQVRSGNKCLCLQTVNFTSAMINSVLKIIDSAPDMIDFGFHMVNCELETIISGVHMIIVKA